jgi:hypothetical protein
MGPPTPSSSTLKRQYTSPTNISIKHHCLSYPTAPTCTFHAPTSTLQLAASIPPLHFPLQPRLPVPAMSGPRPLVSRLSVPAMTGPLPLVSPVPLSPKTAVMPPRPARSLAPALTGPLSQGPPVIAPIPLPPRALESVPPLLLPMQVPAVTGPQPPESRQPLPPLLGQRLRPDNLGKLALLSAEHLSRGISFENLCKHHRGISCLSDPTSLPHAAVPILLSLRSIGAPAHQSTEPWSLAQLDAAVLRGPHKSMQDHIDFLREEFFDMVKAGQWLVLPYSAVRNLNGLRLSPSGVVPQRDRRPRPIIDYTFSGINNATLSRAPDSIQFGAALYHFVQRLQRADTRCGTIYLGKTDVADAFMRVWISLSTIPALGAILLSSYPDEDPLVAFPMILPMGWVDSPNYLCALTKTIADLANARFEANDLATQHHPLSTLANSIPAPDPVPSKRHDGMPPPKTRSQGPLKPPLNFADVYMDDFLAAMQLSGKERDAAQSTLFECIDQVLRPLAHNDNPCPRMDHRHYSTHHQAPNSSARLPPSTARLRPIAPTPNFPSKMAATSWGTQKHGTSHSWWSGTLFPVTVSPLACN